MKDLLKYIKELLAKGFATKAEKAKVKALFDNLTKEEQDATKDDVDQANDLPEDAPDGGDGGID